jgi:acetolactate synthase I/II/III large subunit
MKVADYIIDFFARKGIEKAFVVYGAANGDLIDAFTRNKKIEYVSTMHEQAAGFAAEGYAKIKRLPGLSIVTSGPGATNLVTSVANCYYESIPCIFISGQINSKFLRPHKSIRQVGFQETDIVSIVKPVTKYTKMITNPNKIKYELEKAYSLCNSGRKGPVFLDIPLDVQKTQINPSKLQGIEKNFEKKVFNIKKIRSSIKKYLKDLKKSQRPVFLVGGGVQTANCTKKVLKISEKLNVPCFATWNGLDIITSDFKLYAGRVGTYGGPGRNFGIQNCDLLFGLGTRVSGRITGGNPKTFARESKKYIVDIDKALLKTKYQPVKFHENIYCDLNIFLDIFLEEIKKIKNKNNSFNAWNKRIKYWLNNYDSYKEKYSKSNGYTYKGKNYVHPYAFMNTLSANISNKDVIVGDCGGISVLIGHSLKTKFGQRYHSNNGHAPMGYAFSAAIGSWFGSSKKNNTICLTGDGGFNMNIQELQTLINYKIPVKTFIINNHIYGITKAFQKTNFQGREEACGPKGYNPPDFIEIAKGYKVKAIQIKNNDELEKKIEEVLKYKGPVVCDVNCHEFHIYEPKLIGWKTPIEDMYPYLNRKELKKNLNIKMHESSSNPFMPDVTTKIETME